LKFCNFRHFENLNCISMKPEQKKIAIYIFAIFAVSEFVHKNAAKFYQWISETSPIRSRATSHKSPQPGKPWFATHALHCAFFPALIAITKAHCCTIHPRDTLSGVCPGSRENLAASALRPTPTRNFAVDLSVHTLRFIQSPV
jgi:hypothetical protein